MSEIDKLQKIKEEIRALQSVIFNARENDTDISNRQLLYVQCYLKLIDLQEQFMFLQPHNEIVISKPVIDLFAETLQILKLSK